MTQIYIEDAQALANILSAAQDYSSFSWHRRTEVAEENGRIIKLDLSKCLCMTYLSPDVGILQNLFELDLSFCHNLQSVPSSIGELTLLTVLSFKSCFELEDFIGTNSIIPVLAKQRP